MPKMKSHRGSKKRYKVTGSGKIMRRTSFRKHLLVGKSTARLRRIGDESTISRLFLTSSTRADLFRLVQAVTLQIFKPRR
jgi:large subunit ribosomal protein L35